MKGGHVDCQLVVLIKKQTLIDLIGTKQTTLTTKLKMNEVNIVATSLKNVFICSALFDLRVHFLRPKDLTTKSEREKNSSFPWVTILYCARCTP